MTYNNYKNITRETREARIGRYAISLVPEDTKEWIQRFLGFISRKYPEFCETFLDDLDFSKKQKLIIKYRYSLKNGWKEVPFMEGVNLELRQVMNLHKKVIDRIYRL